MNKIPLNRKQSNVHGYFITVTLKHASGSVVIECLDDECKRVECWNFQHSPTVRYNFLKQRAEGRVVKRKRERE